MAPFLAMADLERARVCSSGLTKTFALIMPWRENKGVCQFKRNLNRFLAKQHLKKDFLQDLPMVCFVVTQHSESALSLCLRYSKISSAATKKSV